MRINDVDFSRLVVHTLRIEEYKHKENSIEVKRRRITSVMKISHKQSSIEKVSLDFDNAFLVNIPPMLLLSSIKKGCITVSLKEEMIVDPHFLCLLIHVRMEA